MFIVFMRCTDIEVLWFSTCGRVEYESVRNVQRDKEKHKVVLCYCLSYACGLWRERAIAYAESARTHKCLRCMPSLDTLFAATVLSLVVVVRYAPPRRRECECEREPGHEQAPRLVERMKPTDTLSMSFCIVILSETPGI